MINIKMEVMEKVLWELMEIANEAETIFCSSQRIQKGIGVYPVAQKVKSAAFKDVKLKIQKNHYGEYRTANATGKIQWRAEYIVKTIAKIIELLKQCKDYECEYNALSSELAERLDYFKTQHPIHLV